MTTPTDTHAAALIDLYLQPHDVLVAIERSLIVATAAMQRANNAMRAAAEEMERAG